MKKFKVDQRSFELVKELLAAGLKKTQISQALGCSRNLVVRIDQTIDYEAYNEMRELWRQAQHARRHPQLETSEVMDSLEPEQEPPTDSLDDLNLQMTQLKQLFVDVALTLEKLGY